MTFVFLLLRTLINSKMDYFLVNFLCTCVIFLPKLKFSWLLLKSTLALSLTSGNKVLTTKAFGTYNVPYPLHFTGNSPTNKFLHHHIQKLWLNDFNLLSVWFMYWSKFEWWCNSLLLLQGRYSLIVAFSPTGWSFGKGKKKSTGSRWQQGTIIRLLST